VQAANGQWHEMNDTTVSVTNIGKVLAQQAYVLFYGCQDNLKSDTKLVRNASDVVNPIAPLIFAAPIKISSHGQAIYICEFT